ncbi:MAG: MBL fold metallo-hydrolase [bacterium]|nr:MBL fold metallo-hydrolase [bacterium]
MATPKGKEEFILTFWGGVGTVTGAHFMLEGAGTRLLVDCGLVQGHFRVGDKENRAPFPYDPASVDALFVTHSHIDHVGRIPKLVHDGFTSPIYSTPPARDIAEAMLYDSMGVLEKEARRDNLPPLYAEADVAAAMRLWKTADYHEDIPLAGGIVARFRDSGHVLGSSMVEFSYNGRKIVFTGDLGNSPSPLLPDPEEVTDADYLVIESVYGDRNHEPHEERKRRLEAIIERTVKEKGVLMIPAFSLERTQEILYEINSLVENMNIPPVPIYLDSPLAIKVTGLYAKWSGYFNGRARALIKGGDDVFNFPGLVKTMTTEESRAILNSPDPKVIIAGSGMSNGGRIIHHEKNYLPDEKNTLLLVGYQAAGTPGRIMQDGAGTVKILGEEVPIRARVETISGYSAHKDSDGLMEFVGRTKDKAKQVFAVMGEPKAALFFVQKLRDYLGVNASAPMPGDRVTLDMK